MSAEGTEIARQQVARFVARFDESYRRLAWYAALPLVLTPELLNYLRNHFLRGQTPWEAEVDLLLSELCRPVGYEQFAMAPEVRAWLIGEMREQLGEAPMREVARLLIRYVQQLSRTSSPFSREALEAEQWSAMVYLEERRGEAARQIAESFREPRAPDASRAPGLALPISEAALARLVRITEELASQLKDYPELLRYAADVGQLLVSPTGTAALADARRAGGAATVRVADVALPDVVPQNAPAQLTKLGPGLWKDLFVAVFVSTTDETGRDFEGQRGYRVATGYPVADDLILTARHVVMTENQHAPARIEVQWLYDKPVDKKSPAWTKADLVWIGAGDLDAALIRCQRPEYLRKFLPGRLTERKPRDGERWQSAAFASTNTRKGVLKLHLFAGVLREMADGDSFLELLEDVSPLAEEQRQGVSGMPVFAGSGILGVVTRVPPSYSHKKLEAVPVWRLLRDEGFRKTLGIDEQRERLESARKLLRRLLERSDAVTGDFAAELGLPCGDILKCREQVVERLLDETPPLERLFELALSVRDRRRGKKDTVGAQVAQELVLAILPAIHDAAVVADVRRRKSDSSVCVLELPTNLRTVAEIIMAGVDRRAARFRPLTTRLIFPEGEACLPEPPESGYDPDGKQFSRDWRTYLLEKFDTDSEGFEGAFQKYLKERFIPSDLRFQASIPEEDLLNTIAEQLRQEADARADGLTYYSIVKMPNNAEEREKQESVLAQLKGKFPHIAFLRLAGGEPLNVEWERYSKLRDLLYHDSEADP